MPNGRMYTFYRDENETWDDMITKKVLPGWMDYCNDHWIDHGNHESMWSFEKRTKAFLDRCAWLWLQDNFSGLESKYKEMMHKVREIPISECAEGVSDFAYSDRKASNANEGLERYNTLCEELDEFAPVPINLKTPKRRRKETRFNRISKLIKENPGAKRTWCCVDGENNFIYNGKLIHIPETVPGYELDSDRTDLMDRIFVIETDNSIQYFDQNVFPISF